MSRVDLPDAGWAELCAGRKASNRKRARYLAALADLSASTVDLPRDPEKPDRPDARHFSSLQTDQANAADCALIACFVKEWSYGEITLDAIADLDGDVFDALKKEAEARLTDMLPDFSPDIDPKAPTSASTGLPPGLSTEGSNSATPSFAGTS